MMRVGEIDKLLGFQILNPGMHIKTKINAFLQKPKQNKKHISNCFLRKYSKPIKPQNPISPAIGGRGFVDTGESQEGNNDARSNWICQTGN